MTIHKLTAGSGYDYLTRQVARQDVTEVGHAGLASYYTDKGEAPGVWVGAGVARIEGLAAGDVVTAEQMTRLFGTGEHPLGEAAGDLGRPFLVYGGRDDVTSFRIEVARRCEAHNRALGLPADAPIEVDVRARFRTEVGLSMFRQQHKRDPLDGRELAGLIAKESRPRTTAVAGYDLTFSPVKSVSTLWAVADRDLSARVEKAHQDAVRDALQFIEERALFTRTGKAGVAQVDVQGLVATAFTHRDSRAGDPDLHTHVAVANKVQTLDGRWLSIDGRVLFKATVTASEVYNTALEKHLRPLGIVFEERTAVPGQDARKRPVREIVGVDPALNQRWSSRRASIQARRSELAQRFQAEHGRPPNPVESIQLAQQATLETRDAKHEPRSLAQQRATWRAEAVTALGSESRLDDMIGEAGRGMVREGPGHRATAAWRQETVRSMMATVQGSRSSWQTWHVRAEAQRRVRGMDVPAAGVEALVDDLTAGVLERSIRLQGSRADRIIDPEQLRRLDGSSVYTVAGSQLFTSAAVLAAEADLVAAAGRTDGRVVAACDVELALVESMANGITLNPGQVTLVREMATSGRRLQLAIAPAGSGKTTAMRALTTVWEASGGHVVGLAPSAAAAAQLHEHAGTTSDTLAQLVYRLNHAPESVQDLAWANEIGPQSLVLIDEAGMADTLSLSTAVTWLLDRGASVRLIGDDQQLAAIGAGGVLGDIRATHGALHLSELMRFTQPAEGAASLALREGRPEALGFYLDAGRVHVGDLATMTEEVFESWCADRGAGRDAIMLAPSRDLVSQLNQRAQSYRLQGATQVGRQVSIADGNRAGTGDLVISRTNDRRLRTMRSDFVKNGDRWTVQRVLDDGSLDVQHTKTGRHVQLPAGYVKESVELGYASTVHTAQGVSVDVMHGLATGEESRQQLYTMMTRGRHANHVYLEVVGDGDQHTLVAPGTIHPRTATDLLEAVLARDESSTSASTVLRQADDPVPLLGEATARYVDALYTAVADLAGPNRLAILDEAADQLVPGMTASPTWPTLRAHLSLIAANGDSPLHVLREATTAREVDTATDPAAVLGWRLDDSGLRNAGPGPLPWIPAVPAVLDEHPTWGPYLAQRAERVSGLAGDVDQATHAGATPGWAAQGHAVAPVDLLARIAVFRAATSVPEDDLRPTGPAQLDKAPALYQRGLRAELAGGATPASHEWAPFLARLSPAVGHDTFAPVLAQRLAAISRGGVNAAAITRRAAGTGPLPDDHAAAALWWRIAGQLSPAVAAQVAGDATITADWTQDLTDALGQERVATMQDSTWWPTLVTSIDHALQRGWNIQDLASTAPEPGIDVDDAQTMAWKIGILTNPPPDSDHHYSTREHEPPEDLAWALRPPAPESVQATDAEWDQFLDSLTTDHTVSTPTIDQVAADPAAVEAALAVAAMIPEPLDLLQPTETELNRLYEQELAAHESPVPLTRLAQVNQLALDYYNAQYAGDGWARGYLADRFGQDVSDHPHLRAGYAPAGWTNLVDHLRDRGVTDTELTTSGLATITQHGRVIDRFRDRALFPITSTDGTVLGFVGRRNPAHTDDTPHAGPKYLNTPNTALFTKGDQLYGALPGLLAAGATPVLVEGPMDAHAITLSTGGNYLGLAPLGTALTQAQAAQLATIGGPVIIATDCDLAGQMAAERDHWLLAQHGLTTLAAQLPLGTDPSSLLQDHGGAAVTNALLASTPLADQLLTERLTNLAGTPALTAAATVLATADPSTWDPGCEQINQATGTTPEQARQALLHAVRTWREDPRAVVATQLADAREVRTRLDGTKQAPELRWAKVAADIDPRLPREPDWPALARVMQHLHDQGHDVAALAATTTVAEDALSKTLPAQDLRYRLVVIAPPPDALVPRQDAGAGGAGRRADDDHALRRQPRPARSVDR